MKGQEAGDHRTVFNQGSYESCFGGYNSLALRMGL